MMLNESLGILVLCSLARPSEGGPGPITTLLGIAGVCSFLTRRFLVDCAVSICAKTDDLLFP